MDPNGLCDYLEPSPAMGAMDLFCIICSRRRKGVPNLSVFPSEMTGTPKRGVEVKGHVIIGESKNKKCFMWNMIPIMTMVPRDMLGHVGA